jgi:hypothetical protein
VEPKTGSEQAEEVVELAGVRSVGGLCTVSMEVLRCVLVPEMGTGRDDLVPLGGMVRGYLQFTRYRNVKRLQERFLLSSVTENLLDLK